MWFLGRTCSLVYKQLPYHSSGILFVEREKEQERERNKSGTLSSYNVTFEIHF